MYDWLAGRSVDRGQVYAATQWIDPVKNRTLLWSWAPVHPNSTMTLLRELTWNAELEQVEFSPIEEQQKLRGAVLEASYLCCRTGTLRRPGSAVPGSASGFCCTGECFLGCSLGVLSCL